MNLRPYPSCKHTKALLSDYTVKHLDGLYTMIIPRDTDGLPITKTDFLFTVHLHHQVRGSVSLGDYTAGKTNVTTIRISHTKTPWEGRYAVAVELLDGWEDRSHPQTHGRCIIANMSFFVVCSSGFGTDLDSSICVPISFAKVCKRTQVTLGSRVVLTGGSKPLREAGIGEASALSVSVDHHQFSDLRYRYIPLKDVQERSVGKDLMVEKTGDFGLQLTNNRTKEACVLLSRLKVSCGDGFKEDKDNCVSGTCL